MRENLMWHATVSAADKPIGAAAAVAPIPGTTERSIVFAM